MASAPSMVPMASAPQATDLPRPVVAPQDRSGERAHANRYAGHGPLFDSHGPQATYEGVNTPSVIAVTHSEMWGKKWPWPSGHASVG